MPHIKWDKEKCDSHGQCEIAAPHLFQLVDTKNVQFHEEISAGQLADAWAAADACPMQAITIIED